MKRFLSVLVASVLCCSLGVPAFAVSEISDVAAEHYLSVDINEEIERALNGETDIEIDTTDFAEAVLERADGTKENVDVYTTTRVLPVPMSFNAEGRVYATTAVASLHAKDKSDVNTGNKEYVTATITLFWTDVFGPANNFRGVSGSWTVATNPDTGKEATLSNRSVALQGSGIGNQGDVYRIYPTSNTFEIKDSAYEDGWTAYTALSKVTINSKETLSVEVSSGQIVIG